MYDSDFYKTLKKPPLLPEKEVFKTVWAILYILMFISLVLVILSDEDEKILGIASFCVQLLLNILWPICFFKYRKIELALFVSVLLMLSVGVMTYIFFDISEIAGILQIPYFIWTFFAIYLNGGIYFLNKDKK